jgi:hypothetical protein
VAARPGTNGDAKADQRNRKGPEHNVSLDLVQGRSERSGKWQTGKDILAFPNECV